MKHAPALFVLVVIALLLCSACPNATSGSDNPNLSLLDFSYGAPPTAGWSSLTYLTPSFSAAVTSYTMFLTGSVYFKAVPEDGDSTMEYSFDGVSQGAVASGAPTLYAFVGIGTYTLEVQVTAAGGATKTYTVTITVGGT